MTLEERAAKAVEMKNSGMYNCAQSVTVALADDRNFDVKNKGRKKPSWILSSPRSFILLMQGFQLRLLPSPLFLKEFQWKRRCLLLKLPGS